jgi:hypothetical protein
VDPTDRGGNVEDTYRKIKASDLKWVRDMLLEKQGWVCPLCGRDMRNVQPRQRCVDHDHALDGPAAGAIRGCLCSNCNGNEGRIKNRVDCSKGNLNPIEWLENLLNYWKKHRTNQTGLIHHTWKSPEERRILKNQKARDYRARKRAGK